MRFTPQWQCVAIQHTYVCNVVLSYNGQRSYIRSFLMPSFVLAFPFTIQSYLHSQLQTIASDSYSNDIALLAIQHQSWSLGSCSVISYNIKWKRKCMQLVIACCVQLYVSFMKRYIAMYIIIVIYIYIFNPTYTTSYRLVTRTAMALYC